MCHNSFVITTFAIFKLAIITLPINNFAKSNICHNPHRTQDSRFESEKDSPDPKNRRLPDSQLVLKKEVFLDR